MVTLPSSRRRRHRWFGLSGWFLIARATPGFGRLPGRLPGGAGRTRRRQNSGGLADVLGPGAAKSFGTFSKATGLNTEDINTALTSPRKIAYLEVRPQKTKNKGGKGKKGNEMKLNAPHAVLYLGRTQ